MEQTEIKVISSTQNNSENIAEHANAADSAKLANNSQ